MPDILTHVYCADFARRNFDSNLIMRQIIDRHIDAFYLGSQGPDFFFYYKIWPWLNSHNVSQNADTIHKSKTALFLNTAIMELKKEDLATKAGQMKLAYWMGFITHYALDSTAHPFIYYFAGIHKDEASRINGDKHYHKYLENTIDTLMSERFKNQFDLPRNQYACLPSKPASLKAVYNHVAHVFNLVYKAGAGAESDRSLMTGAIVQQSVTDMRNLVGLMHDPKKRMRGAFLWVEKIISKPKYISTAAYPASVDTDIDHLNLDHHKWNHPCDLDIEYTDSFIDLFDKSTKLATQLMQYAWETFKDSNDLYDLKERLGNYSYDTGLPCDDPRELQFSDTVFK